MTTTDPKLLAKIESEAEKTADKTSCDVCLDKDESACFKNGVEIGFKECTNLIAPLLMEMKAALDLIDTGSRDIIKAVEDEEVKLLCERIGYGAVMDSAARQWRAKDPVGAFTVGPCVVMVKAALSAYADFVEGVKNG